VNFSNLLYNALTRQQTGFLPLLLPQERPSRRGREGCGLTEFEFEFAALT